MEQRSCGHFNHYWARRTGAVHTTAEFHARSDDESERFQVPNVASLDCSWYCRVC